MIFKRKAHTKRNIVTASGALFAIFLLFIEQSKPNVIYKLESSVVDSTFYLFRILNTPFVTLSRLVLNFKALALNTNNINLLQQENQLLRDQLTEVIKSVNAFQKYHSLYHEIDKRNNSARKAIMSVIYGTTDTNDTGHVFAKVSGVLEKNDIVEDIHGIVGRITKYNDENKITEIQLATDDMFRIPVIVLNESANIFAIAIGSGTKIFQTDKNCQMHLKYFEKVQYNQIKLNDIIITSGELNLIPRGINVGFVSSINKGYVCVKLSSNLKEIDKLMVVDYKD